MSHWCSLPVGARSPLEVRPTPANPESFAGKGNRQRQKTLVRQKLSSMLRAVAHAAHEASEPGSVVPFWHGALGRQRPTRPSRPAGPEGNVPDALRRPSRTVGPLAVLG